MKFQAIVVAIFAAVLGFSGCEESAVTRKAGPDVMASKIGLKVEWIQAPGLNAEENPALYPYGKRLEAGEPVHFRLLSITNASAESQRFYFGAFENREFGLEIRTFCILTAEQSRAPMVWTTGGEIDFSTAPAPLCRYASRWRSRKLFVLRENGELEEAPAREREKKEITTELIEMKPGERIELVALLEVIEGAALPTLSTAPQPNQWSYIPIGTHPENQRLGFGVQVFSSAEVEGTLRPTVWTDGASRIYFGEPPESKSFRSPGYFDILAGMVPGIRVTFHPVVPGIPVFE